MSTNFYWTSVGLAVARAMADDEHARRPPGDERHIGKSWLAGPYCERCERWLEECGTPCPQCALPVAVAPLARGFTWAQDPEVVGGICRRDHNRGAQLIVADDGRRLACEEFLFYLQRCVRRHVMERVGVPDWR